MASLKQLFQHNGYIRPNEAIMQNALDASLTYPYRISLTRIDHFPIPDFYACKHLEFRFSFLDRRTGSFFGNTFTCEFIQDAFLQGSAASLSGMGSPTSKYSSSLNKKVGII